MSTVQENQEKIDQKASESSGKRKITRRILLTLGPVVVIVAFLYFYWTGGRFISTDNAYVQADKTAISAEVSGSIVEVLVEENDFIQKGEPLFRIDPRSYRIALEQAKARLQDAEAGIKKLKADFQQKSSELDLAQSNIDFTSREYNRQSALDSNRAVAKAQLDSALHNYQVSQHQLEIIKAEMDQILARLEGDPDIAAEQLASYRLAQSMVEKAALDLERTTVKAPFSGRVSKIPKVGKHLDPGTPVMSLIADENFWIEANLKETELTHVRNGQQVRIKIDTYPDDVFTGTVQSISPGTGSEFSILPAQNATGNWVKVVQRIPVRIAINDAGGHQVLRSGMSTTITVDTEFHRSLPSWLNKSIGYFHSQGGAVASLAK